MRLSTFTHDFLLLFSGPLVWAVHFLAIYGFIGVVCARGAAGVSWLGIGIGTWGVAGAGLLAIAAIAASFALQPRHAAPDNRRFVRWITVRLGLLAMVAIAWETVTVFLVPVCGVA